MLHKYLGWCGSDGIFMGQKLLTHEVANTIITCLLTKPKTQDIYATVQDHDADGNTVQCPIFADFDGLSALEDTRDFVCKIESELDIVPRIYFSGNKGFHVIIPHMIKGARCHTVVQRLLEKFGSWMSLDSTVYTRRRLLRITNSFNLKGGLFKIPITQEELNLFGLEEIKMLATEARPWTAAPIVIPESKVLVLNELIERINGDLSSLPHTERKSLPDDGNWHEAITPCLRTMLENCPEDGYMNASIVTLAKFFKFYMVECDDAIKLFMSYPHYANRERVGGDVTKVIKCVYRSEHSFKPHCAFGSDGVAMKRYCDVLCRYNPTILW